jgi:DNA primase
MLDGDEAGIKSALRLVTIFGEMDINGRMVVLPEGHDPDSFIRAEGVAGFNRVMEEKKPLLDYFFEINVKKHGLRTLEGRVAFVKSVLPYIEGIRDSVRRRLYTRRLSVLTGVEEDLFLEKARPILSYAGSREDRQPRNAIEEKVVGIIISNPELMELIRGKGVEEHIKDRDVKELLIRALDYYQSNSSLDLKLFLNVLERAELREKAVSTAMDVAECDHQEMKTILSDYLSHVENSLIRDEAKGITEMLVEAEKRGDEKALQELLERKRRVVEAMKCKSAK